MNRACFACVFSVLLPAFVSADELPVRVMSYNLRYATAPDGENAWEKRKEFLAATIRSYDPDLLGTQETLLIQRDYLRDGMPGYDTYGAGRDDGQDRGEMAALFFKKSRFEKTEGGHFWLSTTPQTPGSKGWDAALPRIATWVKLKDKLNPSSLPILYLNTHFDHQGKVARKESAKLLRMKLIELGAGCRVIVTGDFNAAESSEPYTALFGDEDGKPAPVVDTFRVFRPLRTPEEGTFSGFKAASTRGNRIDWIGASRDWDVRLAGIDRTSREGRTPSDHFAVTAVLRPAVKTPTLRVLSYNIHHGEGMDKKFDLPRIAKVIRDADADFVALQEVDDKTTRSSGVDQTAELARLTGLDGRFGKAIDYAGGGYGQTILSRFPIAEVKVHSLPGEPDREKRIAVEAKVKVNDREVSFVTTHLHHINAMFREDQVKMINELFTKTNRVTILAGDMNATPESKPIELLLAHWSTGATDEPSFPADAPKKRIDYVFARPAAMVRPLSSRVIDEAVASDHRPLLAVLELTNGVLAPYTKPTLIAHRGASADAPEHTADAYRLALKYGADYVEPDLQITKDGILICMHDTTLERTTDVAKVFPDRFVMVKGKKTWPVVDFTWEEIQKLDAGSWKDAKFAGAKVPSFQQMIELVKGKAGIIPETKAPGVYEKKGFNMGKLMMEVLKKNGLDAPGSDPKTPVVVQSFSAESLKQLKADGCKLPLIFLFNEGGKDLDDLKAMKAYADGISPSKAVVLARPAIVEEAHKLGMSVTVWTFQSGKTGKYATVKDEMSYFLNELKVDALFTDHPDQFPR